MSLQDYSFIGTGIIYLEEIGGSAGLIDVGNCSNLSIRPQEEKKTLQNFRVPGGGVYNEVSRASGLELSYTFHDFSPANFARALRATTSTVAAGSASHTVTYAADTPIVLPGFPLEVTSVTANGTAVDAPTGGWQLQGSALVIPEGTIGIDVGDSVTVAFTRAAASRVDAMTGAGKQYRLVLIGQNEARGGKRHRLEVFRLSHGLLQEMSLIGDEYGAGEVTNAILYDAARAALGGSGYFSLEIED